MQEIREIMSFPPVRLVIDRLRAAGALSLGSVMAKDRTRRVVIGAENTQVRQ